MMTLSLLLGALLLIPSGAHLIEMPHKMQMDRGLTAHTAPCISVATPFSIVDSSGDMSVTSLSCDKSITKDSAARLGRKTPSITAIWRTPPARL